MLKMVDVRIKGITPLLMHNGALADPTNPIVRAMKKISAKRTGKTDDDILELARLEFMGGLYLDEKGEPCIPGENIEATLVEAARQTKRGKKATSAFIVEGNPVLNYEGPHDADSLWADTRFRFYKGVKLNGKVRIMRMRSIFRSWAVSFTLHYETDTLDLEAVRDILETAQGVGLGDWRPKYGRFEVVS